MNSLGTLQYQTGRGIFRPGGNGGGIFDNNLAGVSGLGGYSLQSMPWLSYSDGTKEYQGDLNDALRKLGQPTITEDGKLGPGTCAAAKKVQASPDYGWPLPSECNKTHTAPSTPTVAPALPSESTMMPGGGGMSRSTKNALIFVGAGVAALGVAYFALKRAG